MKRTLKNAYTLIELLITMCMFFILPLGYFLLIGLWSERNLEFWISYSKGVAVDVPYLLGVATGLLGPITVLLNIVAEIARICVS